MKKIFLIACVLSSVIVSAQQRQPSPAAIERAQKRAEKREKINQLIKQEEEGALIYQKQNAFGFKFNTDGWGAFYERGKYKNLTNTSLWWIELGERMHQKEDKTSTLSSSSGFLVVSSYKFGKQNNFYYLKLGLGQQKLIGGKGNRNGVAVSAIYGGGITAGLLKPYYIEIQNPYNSNKREDVRYNGANDSLFLDPTIIIGRGAITKGLGEVKFVPGAHVRTAIRFDYGRYNEVLSAIEVGLNAEYYSQKMPIMVGLPEKNFFFNAYIALTVGKRK